MRITLVIASLGAGGAERVMSTLANYWAETSQHQLTLITFAPAGSDFYELHPGIQRVGLGLLSNSRSFLEGLIANWQRVRALRRAIRAAAPQAVISFMDITNVCALVATRGLSIPVVVSERIDPRHFQIGSVWSALRRLTYRWADAVVVQTQSVETWARGLVRPSRVRVVPNPVAHARQLGRDQALPEMAGQPGLKVLAMGRLTPQKGFDLLLRAFRTASERCPDWTLFIYGEGPERQALNQLIVRLGLESHAQLAGVTKEPMRALAGADLFVMSSRFEGFPNALCEAMASGLPVISFDCPSGPRDIIRHDVDGLLVPAGNADALAGTMMELMGDPARRARLGERAVEVQSRFSLATVAGEWDALLRQLGKEPIP